MILASQVTQQMSMHVRGFKIYGPHTWHYLYGEEGCLVKGDAAIKCGQPIYYQPGETREQFRHRLENNIKDPGS